MCRQACFPKGFKRNDAIDILLDMEKFNTDGVGYCYLKNGEFVVRKWTKSLSKVLRREKNFLNDIRDAEGYTLVHLRAASHGCIHYDNTHPFITNSGDYAIMHNGIFSDYKLAKLCLKSTVAFKGDTDSEVAAAIIDTAGIKAFSDEMDMSGVFCCLKKDGTLYVIKTSGDMCAHQLPNKTCLLSSELDVATFRQQELLTGYYVFNKDCQYVKHHEKKDKWSSKWSKPYSPSYGGSGFYDENEVFQRASADMGSHRDYDQRLLPYHYQPKKIDKIEISWSEHG